MVFSAKLVVRRYCSRLNFVLKDRTHCRTSFSVWNTCSKSVIVKAVPWYVYEKFGNSTATMAQVGVTTDALCYTAVVWIIEGVRLHATAIETASELKHCSCFFHANLQAVYLHALHTAAAVVGVLLHRSVFRVQSIMYISYFSISNSMSTMSGNIRLWPNLV